MPRAQCNGIEIEFDTFGSSDDPALLLIMGFSAQMTAWEEGFCRRLADEGFHAPLDLVDGAARVYDPIVRGEQGEDLFGCFLKDYAPAAW